MFLLLLPLLFNQAFAVQDYVIKHDHIILEYHNKDYISYQEITNTKYNRSTRTFSTKIKLIKDITNLIVNVDTFVFLSNEYRRFPVKLNVDVCKAYKANLYGIRDFTFRRSNFTTCPIKAGLYVGNNIIPDDDMMPPHIPQGSYKLVARLITNDIEGSRLAWYGSIIEPTKFSRG